MNINFGKNNFYNTFSPFIGEKTKTAEKTIDGKGRREIHFAAPKYKVGERFYNYVSAGGFLIFPILAMAISKKNIDAARNKASKEYFKLLNRNSSGFIHKVWEKVAIAKQAFLKGFWSLIKPIKVRREQAALKLRKSTNNSLLAKTYRYVNNIFKGLKTKAAMRRYLCAADSFKKIEKILEEPLKLIEESASGTVKAALPKNVLKNPANELPIPVDLSKTADGKNRVEEIRRIIKEIKKLLISDKGNFEEMVKKVTFSCEDVFAKGEATLASLRMVVSQNGFNTKETDKLIRNIYQNLVRYRFAEKIPSMDGVHHSVYRKIHMDNVLADLNVLKKMLPENSVVKEHIKTFRKLATRAKPEKMGLLERLRTLLKCNDIVPDGVKEGTKTSLFKHVDPNKYMDLKNEIKAFAENLKFAQKTKNELLPTDIKEIDRGGIFTKAVAVGAPAIILGANIYNSPAGENKAKNKRNFYSFIMGSLVMLASNYCTMNSQKRSILYGILAAFLTSKLAERYIKK